MIFYWILFCFILLIALYWKDKRKAAYLIFFILFFLGSTRARTVGNDLNGGYWLEYVHMGHNPNNWGVVMRQFEYGFLWLMANFKYSISSDPLIFFHILFIITFINYYVFLKKESRYTALSLFFMLAFAYYFQLYNGMRQEFCYSMILIFLSYFVLHNHTNFNIKKRYVTNRRKYYNLIYFYKKPVYLFLISTIVVSVLFHKSMLIMLIFPLVYKFYKRISTKVLIIVLLISSFLSLTLASYASTQLAILSFVFDDGSSNFSSYMSGTDGFGQYSKISNILNTIFCIYTVFSHRYKKSFYVSCYVIGVVILNILAPINWIFQRLAFPFMFFRVVAYADLWYTIPSKREKNVFRFAVLLLSFIMYQNRLSADNYKDVVPYINCLF